jgi:hypothetical protein
MPPVVRYQVSRGTADCAIVALSTYLETPYEDVLALAVLVTNSKAPHHRGLWTREIKKIAKMLGAPLRLRRSFDMMTAEGIAGFKTKQVADHVGFCKRGMVWDTNGDAVEIEHYCAENGYTPVSLLERVP